MPLPIVQSQSPGKVKILFQGKLFGTDIIEDAGFQKG
jgi:hypothetical protein